MWGYIIQACCARSCAPRSPLDRRLWRGRRIYQLNSSNARPAPSSDTHIIPYHFTSRHAVKRTEKSSSDPFYNMQKLSPISCHAKMHCLDHYIPLPPSITFLVSAGPSPTQVWLLGPAQHGRNKNQHKRTAATPLPRPHKRPPSVWQPTVWGKGKPDTSRARWRRRY